MRFLTLRYWNVSLGQKRQGRRGGDGKPAMCAFNKAGAFDYGTRQDARFAQHFQSDGSSDDVHDGIHRANFVKMNLLRRQAMDLSLGDGEALKNGDGFLLYPIGKATGRDQLVDFR